MIMRLLWLLAECLSFQLGIHVRCTLMLYKEQRHHLDELLHNTDEGKRMVIQGKTSQLLALARCATEFQQVFFGSLKALRAVSLFSDRGFVNSSHDFHRGQIRHRIERRGFELFAYDRFQHQTWHLQLDETLRCPLLMQMVFFVG
ncbi:hypothetical protein AUEXF2481DRAFT_569500 [Aureobasidium subglaciale EXF-2481]|uniref:Secreted protein n=1 Tax=Aureobasidium subglaciale (strain EXF-2481) TaxID=1043005 RepID=A0A074XXW9_AURSE|nr:uncharacterized protein AUEXF2481DRAFT_569500 [Aureobasidium subglaciale EXF-2481]KEQ90418.1 hypothetical protein AUEXF2481DRAFT_569500 [Aureobasidium subglaciale EXF-2481]